MIVKCFRVAAMNDMKDYVRPSVKRSPGLVILYCYNDLKTETSPKEIASD